MFRFNSASNGKFSCEVETVTVDRTSPHSVVDSAGSGGIQPASEKAREYALVMEIWKLG